MRIFTVILADDEPQILQGMTESIPWEKFGFKIMATAGNGMEALELTKSLRPDLLISDIKMPFMDGLEVSKILRDNLMNIKIVLFSGWDDFEYARSAIRYGVSEYVLKPIDITEMGKLLTRMHNEIEQEYEMRNNRERQEQLYKESLPILREQFLVRFIEGKIDGDSALKRMKLLELNIAGDEFIVAILSMSDKNESVLTQISILETICEMLDKVCNYIKFAYYNRYVFIITVSSDDTVINVIKSLEEAAHMSKQYFEESFSVGLGLSCGAFKDLPKSFIQANEALEYCLVSTDESVIYYNDIRIDSDNQSVIPIYSTDGLERAIKQGSKEQIELEVEKIIKQLESYRLNVNEYQIIILEIIFSVSRLYRQYNLMTDEIFADSKRITMKILSLQTGEQLNYWLKNYCDYTSFSIRRQRMDQNNILAQKAKSYIDEHFRESDLSVEVLCREFHVSTSHFSNIFHREIGMSFLSYLTKVRIEEAVRLLLTTDYKSRAIGEMVGYPEPNYFSYVFKKNMNISPANFRKKEGKDDNK